jgi:hypothetical protein
VTDRSFADIMSLLNEHDQLKNLSGVIVNDAFINTLCARLAELPIPQVSSEEVRRAWARQRQAFDGPPGVFDQGAGA